MIVITGATGHIGGRAAELVAASGKAFRMTSREPSRLPEIPGAEKARADYEDPESLKEAFRGVKQAFIVSGYAPEGERAQGHINAIDAAVHAGAEHIVYLSFHGASPLSKFPMGRDHFLTEQHLAATGVSHTCLRDDLYLDGLPEMFDESGMVRGPAADGKAAWVSREDVAQVVAAVLLDPAKGGGSLDITGPQAFGFAEAAERLSRLTGRKLGYVDESLSQARAWRAETGVPDWVVDIWVGSYEAMAAGEMSSPAPTVKRILGREPLDLETYFQRNPHLLESLRK